MLAFGKDEAFDKGVHHVLNRILLIVNIDSDVACHIGIPLSSRGGVTVILWGVTPLTSKLQGPRPSKRLRISSGELKAACCSSVDAWSSSGRRRETLQRSTTTVIWRREVAGQTVQACTHQNWSESQAHRMLVMSRRRIAGFLPNANLLKLSRRAGQSPYLVGDRLATLSN